MTHILAPQVLKGVSQPQVTVLCFDITGMPFRNGCLVVATMAFYTGFAILQVCVPVIEDTFPRETWLPHHRNFPSHMNLPFDCYKTVCDGCPSIPEMPPCLQERLIKHDLQNNLAWFLTLAQFALYFCFACIQVCAPNSLRLMCENVLEKDPSKTSDPAKRTRTCWKE